MRILGVDPGTGRMGYGVIDAMGAKLGLVDFGCIQTTAGQPIAERLEIIFNDIRGVIEKYQPEVLSVEKLFFSRNVTTALSVGEARGVILLCGELKKMKIVEYTPLQVKQSVTGYGKAEKGQIQRMVQMILKMEKPPRPDDAADALAVAICASGDIQLTNPKIQMLHSK